MIKKISKEEFLNLKLVSLVDKNILNKKNHPKIPYVGSIKILTNNFKLVKISEILNYWKNKDFNDKLLNNLNWMYVYCIKYGFLKNLDTKNINIYGNFKYTDRKYNLTLVEADTYLSSLHKMDSLDLEKMLKEKPFSIYKKYNIINDGTHRCCAMIGRLIRNLPYVPLYIKYI